MTDFSNGDLIVLINEDGEHPFVVVAAPRKREPHLLLRSCVTGRTRPMDEALLSLRLWRGAALHFRDDTEEAGAARALMESRRPPFGREFAPRDYVLKYGYRRFLERGASRRFVVTPQLQDYEGDRE